MKKILLFILLFNYSYGFFYRSQINYEYLKSEIKDDYNYYLSFYNDNSIEGFDLESEIIFGDKYIFVNQLNIKKKSTYLDISIGRLKAGLGAGYSYNPTDLFNPYSIQHGNLNDSFKIGRDLLIIENSKLNLKLVYGLEEKIELDKLSYDSDSDFALIYNDYIFNFNYQLGYIFYGDKRYDYNNQVYSINKDEYLFTNISVPISDFNLTAELKTHLDYYEYIIGIDYLFPKDNRIIIEYYHNDFATSNKEEYIYEKLISGNLLAKDYLFLYLINNHWINYEYNCYSIINLNDQSSLVGLLLKYNHLDMLILSLSCEIYDGKPETEYHYWKSQYGEYLIRFSIELNI